MVQPADAPIKAYWQPGCTSCHPRLWKTLEKGATADGQMTLTVTFKVGTDAEAAETLLAAMRNHPLGRDAAMIGQTVHVDLPPGATFEPLPSNPLRAHKNPTSPQEPRP